MYSPSHGKQRRLFASSLGDVVSRSFENEMTQKLLRPPDAALLYSLAHSFLLLSGHALN